MVLKSHRWGQGGAEIDSTVMVRLAVRINKRINCSGVGQTAFELSRVHRH